MDFGLAPRIGRGNYSERDCVEWWDRAALGDLETIFIDFKADGLPGGMGIKDVYPYSNNFSMLKEI